MQENDSGGKGSTPTPKPTKYRLACDSCQHSKIRCDQERPECRRCAKKGIECVYSPARRAGRPRTRNNSKSFSSIQNNAPASLNRYFTPMTEHGITNLPSGWVSPFALPSILPISENCSSSSSSSNTPTIPSMAKAIQLPSPENLEFSSYRQSDDEFLRGVTGLDGSQYGTPKQTTNGYYPMSPEFHIAPELLSMSFCGAPWEQQRQQQEHEQHQPASSSMLLGEGMSYFGLLTPGGQQLVHDLDQHQEGMPTPDTCSNNIESYSYPASPQQQIQPKVSKDLDHAPLSTPSCKCVSTLLDHLITHFDAPSSFSLGCTSAALSNSRKLITYCCTTMACPNACSTRPSAALIICEAIDRALLSLKLGGTSLWVAAPASVSSYEDGTCSLPSSLSSSASLSSSPSGGNSIDITLSSSVIDEGHESLRCGALPILGADKRAVVQVLLVKRVLELQGVLERLQDTLLPGLVVNGDVTAKKPLLALCSGVVEEFARKVAERVETVKLQI
jgi:hypothetical protein